MARSTYIYLLQYDGYIVGAFTVKHEMVRYIGRHLPIDRCTVYRLRDGERDSGTIMSREELGL